MDERRTTARKSDFISWAWSQKNENSKEISESFSNSTPKLLVKRVVKETNFYILNNVECPAVLLELGFLSRAQDRDYFTS